MQRIRSPPFMFFYLQRKKEAIALVCVIIWGYTLPTAISQLEDGRSIEEIMNI